MKKFIVVFLIIPFFLLSCCSTKAGTIDKPSPTKKESKVENKSDKETIEALKQDDPRRQQIMTLTWQIQYYREQLKTMEMKKMIECYQGKNYRDTVAKIENLNKQIRQILLL